MIILILKIDTFSEKKTNIIKRIHRIVKSSAEWINSNLQCKNNLVHCGQIGNAFYLPWVVQKEPRQLAEPQRHGLSLEEFENSPLIPGGAPLVP